MKIFKHKEFYVICWLVFYLVLIDAAVNIIFSFPSNPQKTTPSFLQGYFEYGRSTEGKFSAMIKAAKLQKEPTVGYGWLKKKNNYVNIQKPGLNKTSIAAYGMSHTKCLATAIEKVNSNYIIREITAPGAPVGWSFTAYDIDKSQHNAQVVILGVMTENVAMLGATSGATTYFDLGHPYTFPRYKIKNGKLTSLYPPFFSEESFLKYFNDATKWREYRSWLAENDKFYNPLLFINTFIDNSALLRVVRRAYAENIKKKEIDKIYSKNGFDLNSEEIKILRAIILDFAQSARIQKRIPIVYLVNNEGRSDHLYKALKTVLEENKILYLSTHIICPPDDPKVFTGVNSHFTLDKDTELAKEMIKIIEKAKADNNHGQS